jgi:hypothetical protein
MFRYLSLFFASTTLYAQADFFEKKIRPVLATKCYMCHSVKSKSPMGGLVLDTKAGLAKAQPKLLTALRYTDSKLQMPPTGKLADSIIADFERWVAAGAHDPRTDDAGAAEPKSSALGIEQGRSWWAFQPVREQKVPSTKASTRIDAFVLAKLAENKLKPSAEADARTLVRRAYLDLWGYAPTFEETQAFLAKPDYAALLDKLLASPHYGERWARYWMDVARYAEDNPTSEATNQPYPTAWRYRDWVIEAMNKDIPYPQFVKLQLAADAMPGTPRSDYRALAYVGAAPVYHKDARLSKEVIETLASDDWDERVDAVSRGLLGLTVACARCHDHKFDPILTKDYYALAGVFASTSAVQRPLRDVDPKIEQRFMYIQQRLIHLDYLAKLLAGEPGTKPEESAKKVVLYKAEIQKLKEEYAQFGEENKDLIAQLDRIGAPRQRNRGAEMPGMDVPFTQAVYDAGTWIDGSDPDITYMDYRPGTPRDLPVFLRGSVATPGEPAPRQFLTVLAKGESTFRKGSGRLELAERIFSDGSPLAARVIVNRVWGWHVGKPLVPTPSDFGTQGEKPTHPELLEDLSARFIANGWSMKWLHREIMLTAAYKQSSHPRADGEASDPTNRWLWRMNSRRMDIEAFRDSILRSSATLNETMFGTPKDLEDAANTKRTVYARVSRGRLHTIFRLYDFSDPSQHSPGRESTTTPLQQLFVMNSAFLQDQAAALAKRVETETDAKAQVRNLYRYSLARDPTAGEVDLALSYLNQASLPLLAQALLSTNEFIFWP